MGLNYLPQDTFNSPIVPSKRKYVRNISRRVHERNGFPHFSSFGAHHCMCLDTCCQSWDTGCICRTCPCRTGVLHGQVYDPDLDTLIERIYGPQTGQEEPQVRQEQKEVRKVRS